MTSLYMIIDISALEQTKILKIARLHEAGQWGRLYKAEGKNVIGPPLSGRGFSKLTMPQLQYMYWNTFNKVPPDEYAVLVESCKVAAGELSVDDTRLETLQSRVGKLDSEQIGVVKAKDVLAEKATPQTIKEKVTPVKKEKLAKPAEEGIIRRPAENSTTGLVWNIADEAYDKLAKGGKTVDEKALSKAVKSECEKEGINQSTVSVQLSKWKKWKKI